VSEPWIIHLRDADLREPLTDLADILAEHENHPDPIYGVDWCHNCRTTEWPCLPYRRVLGAGIEEPASVRDG
jgi:hypothetical protein